MTETMYIHALYVTPQAKISLFCAYSVISRNSYHFEIFSYKNPFGIGLVY